MATDVPANFHCTFDPSVGTFVLALRSHGRTAVKSLLNGDELRGLIRNLRGGRCELPTPMLQGVTIDMEQVQMLRVAEYLELVLASAEDFFNRRL